jgi:phospholipase C
MLRRIVQLIPLVLVFPATIVGSPITAEGSLPTPIRHVVIIDQENHSFDNVLGWLCLQLNRCQGPMRLPDGTPVGLIHDGTTIALPPAEDIVPRTPHNHDAQVLAVDGGRMDSFDLMVEGTANCNQASGYSCYQAYRPNQIPNLAALGTNFVIADHTFQSDVAASWGSHLGLVAGSMDGFYGDNPTATGTGSGWGCDSNRDALWTPPGGGAPIFQPSCVPDPSLAGRPYGGAYRATQVQWVPTIMDRLDAAQLPWKIYAGKPAQKGQGGFQSTGYQWATCPSFADCLYTAQANNVFDSTKILVDAAAGQLPALSIVTPTLDKSQHNTVSMKLGDNWIGQVLEALESSPEWSSTAVFITYDDCGCFYDHVAPPPGLGVRVPMVIVSPFARRAFTDSNVASYASLLAFTEYVFGLSPLATSDASAYNFLGSFDFTHANLSAVPMVTSSVSAEEQNYIKAHPDAANDPT